MEKCRKIVKDRQRISRLSGNKTGPKKSMVLSRRRQRRTLFRFTFELDGMQVKVDNLALAEKDMLNKEICLTVRYLPELLELMSEFLEEEE